MTYKTRTSKVKAFKYGTDNEPKWFLRAKGLGVIATPNQRSVSGVGQADGIIHSLHGDLSFVSGDVIVKEGDREITDSFNEKILVTDYSVLSEEEFNRLYKKATKPMRACAESVVITNAPPTTDDWWNNPKIVCWSGNPVSTTTTTSVDAYGTQTNIVEG